MVGNNEILNNSSIQSGINPLSIYLLIIGCILVCVVAFVFLFLFLKHIKNRSKITDEMYYRTIFSSQFELTGDIQAAWEKTQKHFDKKSKTYDVIQLALYYLDHSILHDYETAMKKIEVYFTDEETKEMHREVLDKTK